MNMNNHGQMPKYGREIPKAQTGFEPGTELIGGSDDWTNYYTSDDAKDYRDRRYQSGNTCRRCW